MKWHFAGLVRSGTLGIGLQVVSLTAAIAPAVLARLTTLGIQDTVITHMLVGGLIMSRFGLWLFDLCVSQLIQDRVDTQSLGMCLTHCQWPNLRNVNFLRASAKTLTCEWKLFHCSLQLTDFATQESSAGYKAV